MTQEQRAWFCCIFGCTSVSLARMCKYLIATVLHCSFNIGNMYKTIYKKQIYIRNIVVFVFMYWLIPTVLQRMHISRENQISKTLNLFVLSSTRKHFLRWYIIFAGTSYFRNKLKDWINEWETLFVHRSFKDFCLRNGQ